MQERACLAAATALATAAAFSFQTSATAQTYPDHVVQIIVPATAGSSADILGRVLAEGFSSRLGKPFIVVDKAALPACSAPPRSPAPSPTATR